MATKEKTSTDILAELMLKERAEVEEQRQEKKQKLADADTRRQASDAEKIKNENRRMSNCDHLQGNHKLGEAPFIERSHMSLHTFGGPSTTDARRIRCNKCGHKWYPGDGAEFYVRDGVKVPNPTGMGWKDAYKVIMKGKTTGNKPSTGFIDVFTAPVHQEE